MIKKINRINRIRLNFFLKLIIVMLPIIITIFLFTIFIFYIVTPSEPLQQIEKDGITAGFFILRYHNLSSYSYFNWLGYFFLISVSILFLIYFICSYKIQKMKMQTMLYSKRIIYLYIIFLLITFFLILVMVFESNMSNIIWSENENKLNIIFNFIITKIDGIALLKYNISDGGVAMVTILSLSMVPLLILPFKNYYNVRQD